MVDKERFTFSMKKQPINPDVKVLHRQFLGLRLSNVEDIPIHNLANLLSPEGDMILAVENEGKKVGLYVRIVELGEQPVLQKPTQRKRKKSIQKKTRQQMEKILEMVKKKPGMQAHQLAEKLGYRNEPINRILDMMQEEGMVIVIKDLRTHRRVYENAPAWKNVKPLMEEMETLLRNEPMTISELEKKLKHHSPSVIEMMVLKLKNEGRIESVWPKTRGGPGVKYRIKT